MTWEEVKNLQISNIIAGSPSELNDLVKQSLSIVGSSTLKDDEIQMLINAGASDLIRQGIDVQNNINDGLIQGAIVMYVKANFGMVDINEKKQAWDRYIQTITNLSLSQQYLISEE